jgi:hypothetical protein
VDRAVELLISEMLQGRPADKHTIQLEDFGHQCQSSVNGRPWVTAQDKLVIRVRGFVIAKHNPVVPAKLSNVIDVGGIPCHNGLRHLASGHINVVTHSRADICLKFKTMVL